MPALPGTTEVSLYQAKYVYSERSASLRVDFFDNLESFDLHELLSVINKFKPTSVMFCNIETVSLLNDLLRKTKHINIPSMIRVGGVNIKSNNTVIDIESMNKNAKLHFIEDDEEQNDFCTWAHNLNPKDKTFLRTCISDEQRRLFDKENMACNYLCNKIKEEIPNIDLLDTRSKLEKIFDYIGTNYPYSSEVLTDGGSRVRPGTQWSQNPMGTFEHKRGVCSGRSNLLKLVANSRHFNIPCYVVSGELGSISHAWNEVILDGEVYEYDLSFNLKHVPFKELAKNRKIEEHDGAVLDLLSKNKVKRIPPLPPRNH